MADSKWFDPFDEGDLPLRRTQAASDAGAQWVDPFDYEQASVPVQYEKPTPLERLGRGFVDAGEGVKDIYMDNAPWVDPAEKSAWNAQVQKDRDIYEKGRGEDAGIDWMRISGNALPYMAIPGGPARLGAQMGLGAATGAAAGAAQYTEGSERGANTLLGGVLGTAGGGLFHGGSQLVGKGLGAFRPKPAASSVDDVLQQRGMSVAEYDPIRGKVENYIAEGFTPEEAVRRAEIEAQGLVPTQSAVSRNQADQVSDELLRKSPVAGDTYRSTLEQNNRRLAQNLEEMNPSQLNKYEGGEVARKALESGDRRWGAVVDSVYKDARGRIANDLGAVGQRAKMPLPSLQKAMDELSVDSPMFQAAWDSAFANLRKAGVVNKKGVFVKGIEPESAETLRKTFGRLSRNDDKEVARFGATALRSLQDDLDNGPFGDYYQVARRVARHRFETFNDPELVAKVINGKIPPDVLTTRVLSAPVRDITAFKKSMMQSDPKSWATFKGSIVGEILERSYQGQAVNNAGDRVISGANMKRHIQKFGIDRLKAIFDEGELAKLRQLTRAAGDLTIKPDGTVNTSNTGFFNSLFSLLSSVPVAGTVVGAIKAAGQGREGLLLDKAGRQALKPSPQKTPIVQIPGAPINRLGRGTSPAILSD